MHCGNIILGGESNLDRSKPGCKEGKLVDLEEVPYKRTNANNINFRDTNRCVSNKQARVSPTKWVI